jgi:multicomponent Na+:H+ antiporter subunit E
VNAFLLNLLFAAVWAALVGEVDTPHLVFGFVLGYGVLWLLRPAIGGSYHRRLPMFVGFVLFFLRELVVSTMRVAWEVITPRKLRHTGIIAVPLDARTDTEITVFANLLTLTPGTLSLDVSDDRRVLYVHAMFVDDPDAMRREIKDGMERRVLALLRGGAS